MLISKSLFQKVSRTYHLKGPKSMVGKMIILEI